MTALEHAETIARGDSRQLPCLDHLHALLDEILRLRMENGTLRRSLQMLAKQAKEDMDARDAWADEQDTVNPS